MSIFKNYLVISLAAIFAVFIHQYTKALTSYILGDKAIKNRGQLTLNPFRYFEPIGFIFILFFGYGWGKPIETNSMNYKDRNKGTILTYTMPIIANIIVAFIFYNLSFLWTGFFVVAQINLSLAVFNLIPIYPLCGEKLLKCFINPNKAMKYMQFETVIRMIVILLIVMGPLKFALDFVVTILETILRIFVIIK